MVASLIYFYKSCPTYKFDSQVAALRFKIASPEVFCSSPFLLSPQHLFPTPYHPTSTPSLSMTQQNVCLHSPSHLSTTILTHPSSLSSCSHYLSSSHSFYTLYLPLLHLHLWMLPLLSFFLILHDTSPPSVFHVQDS